MTKEEMKQLEELLDKAVRLCELIILDPTANTLPHAFWESSRRHFATARATAGFIESMLI